MCTLYLRLLTNKLTVVSYKRVKNCVMTQNAKHVAMSEDRVELQQTEIGSIRAYQHTYICIVLIYHSHIKKKEPKIHI